MSNSKNIFIRKAGINGTSPAPLLMRSTAQSSIQNQIGTATPRTFENAAEYSMFLDDILSPIIDAMSNDQYTFEMLPPSKLRALGTQLSNSSPLLNEEELSNYTLDVTGGDSNQQVMSMASNNEEISKPFENLRLNSKETIGSHLIPRASTVSGDARSRPMISIPKVPHHSPTAKSPKSPVSTSSNQSTNTLSPSTPQKNITAYPNILSASDVNSNPHSDLSPLTPGSPQRNRQLQFNSKRAPIMKGKGSNILEAILPRQVSDDQEQVSNIDGIPIAFRATRKSLVSSDDDLIVQAAKGIENLDSTQDFLGACSSVPLNDIISPKEIQKKMNDSVSVPTTVMSPLRGFFSMSKEQSIKKTHPPPINATKAEKGIALPQDKHSPINVHEEISPEQLQRASTINSKDEPKRKNSLISEMKLRASNVISGDQIPAIMGKKISVALGKTAVQTTKPKTIFDDASVLLARCIVVYDINSNPHAIDLHNINTDAKAIREKILAKFTMGMGGYSPNEEYELYIRAKAFDSGRFIRDTSIDDLTLLEICSSPDHPYRGQIEFDKKRHPRIVANANTPKIKPKRTKIRGKNRATKRRDSFEDFDVDEVYENEKQLAEKLKSFFGENVDAAPKKIKARTMKRRGSMDEIEGNNGRSNENTQQAEKLKDFFGENIVHSASLPAFFPTTSPSSPTPLVPALPRERRKKHHKASKATREDEFIENMSDGSMFQLSEGLDVIVDDDLYDEEDEKSKQNISKLQDFFGENVAAAANSSLANGKKVKQKGNTENVKSVSYRDSIIPFAKSGSKKLEDFFGDRPPPELIAKNMDTFFPGLQSLQKMFSGNIKQVKQLQEIAFESAKNKRMSKLELQQQQAKITVEKRKTILLDILKESILEEKKLNERASRKSIEIDDVRASSTTLSKFEKDDILLAAHVQTSFLDEDALSLDIFSKVEQMLNMTQEAVTERTASNSDFLDTFAINPDNPTRINWIQGPLIGMGSFGKVFYGANCETGEIMAVKQVPIKNTSLDSKTKKKMLMALHTEIELLKNLEHTNIVRYLGYYTEKDVINVFLEYVSGGSVTSALALMGPFDELLVKRLIIQVLHGLDYLHEMHIIHRDIKGGNILIDDDGVAKISDFGISKKHKRALAYDTSSVMSVQGTVYWMAPEVIKGKGYSAKVDIWSLGCVVLEMLTGKHPWQNLDEIQTMWRLGRLDKPPLPENISSEAKLFLQAAFTTDPKDRPTALLLLTHEFTFFDVFDLDFRQYKEAAILKKQQLDLENEDNDSLNSDDAGSDENDSEECEDEDDEMQA